MNIETFFEARDLYDKYQLCEKVMEYLSDGESVKGQKYLETLKQFVDAFKMEFMAFAHERMEAVGMQFEELHCPEHSESEAPIEPPTEEKEPKFPIGSNVEVVVGDFTGRVGTVKEFERVDDSYYVSSDFNDNGTLFSIWFLEPELKAYVEESEENPEESTLKFKEGDIVEILYGEATGKLAKVLFVSDGVYRVEFLDDGTTGSLWYSESELDPYPEENGAGYTDPTEGE